MTSTVATIASSSSTAIAVPAAVQQTESKNDEKVMDLNNKAVSFIQQDSYSEALFYLKGALRLVKGGLDQTTRAEEDQDDEYTTVAQGEGVTVQSVLVNQRTDASSRVSSSNMYDRAFLLSGASEEEIYSSRANMNRTSCVVLYNMALVYHLSGTKGNKQDQNYRNALRLYSMGSRILSDGAMTYSSDYLLSLALVNNQGHIHANYFRNNEAQACFSRMYTILVRLPLAYSARFEEDVNHFRLNVFLVRTHNAAPAA